MKKRCFLIVLLVAALFIPASSQIVIKEEARALAMDSIIAKYKALGALPLKERCLQTSAFMKTIKEIADSGITEDGNVWALFKDGVPYEIFGNMQALPPSKTEGSSWFPVSPSDFRGPRLDPESDTEARPFPAAWRTSETFPRPSGGQDVLQGNDLPVSTRARVAMALGNAFKDVTETIRRQLKIGGYNCVPGADASVETLKNLQGDGVFFLQAHGGDGEVHDPKTNSRVIEYILSTSSLWSVEQSNKYARQNMFKDGLLGVCEAVADRDPATQQLIDKRYFTITTRFIKKYWMFAENSFVFIDACNSIRLKETMTSAEVGVSVYGGYISTANDYCLDSVLFLFDRMLGANEITPREEIAPQRPFDYHSIALDMERKGLNPIPRKPDCKILFGLGPGNFGLLAPSLKVMSVLAYRSRLELTGLFGKDPGEKNRRVQMESVALPVESWEPERIVCHLPGPEIESAGEVTVINRGRLSNSRWLTRWTGTVQINRSSDEGRLHLIADFFLVFASDPWPYRERAGDKPVDNKYWTISSMAGSTCMWNASGEVSGVVNYQNQVVERWTGKGSPRIVLDWSLLPSLDGTFEVGGVPFRGNTLAVDFVILDQFTKMSQRSPAPVQLGRYTPKESDNCTVFWEPDREFNFPNGRIAVGDNDQDVITWSAMTASHRMPKDRPR
jgi:hypothetical protein